MNEIIKHDINFLEKPLWSQSSKKPNNFLFVWTDDNGYTFESVKGVPGKVDILILYFLMLECQNNHWEEHLFLSRYKILKNCGMGLQAEKQKRLMASLECWKRVTVIFSGTFYTLKGYKHLEFGIIDDWGLTEDNKLEIRLNQKFIEKIKNSDFFKYVSFSQMKSLRSPLALRLYELLVKTFHKRAKWEIDVMKLAEKIPMSEKYFSDVVPKIEAATKRINEQTDLNVEVKTIKIERGKGKFIFTLQNSSTIDAVKEHNTTDKKQKKQTKSGLEKVKVTTEDIKKSRDSNILNDLRKQTDEYLNDLVNIGSKNAKIVLNERRENENK